MILLSHEEIAALTGKQTAKAQARALDTMGIPYRVRPDKSIAISRAVVETALGSHLVTNQARVGRPQLRFGRRETAQA